MVINTQGIIQSVLGSVICGLLFWVGNATMENKAVSIETKGDVRVLSANVEGYQKTTEQAIRTLSSRVDKIEVRLDKIQEQTR